MPVYIIILLWILTAITVFLILLFIIYFLLVLNMSRALFTFAAVNPVNVPVMKDYLLLSPLRIPHSSTALWEPW